MMYVVVGFFNQNDALSCVFVFAINFMTLETPYWVTRPTSVIVIFLLAWTIIISSQYCMPHALARLHDCMNWVISLSWLTIIMVKNDGIVDVTIDTTAWLCFDQAVISHSTSYCRFKLIYTTPCNDACIPQLDITLDPIITMDIKSWSVLCKGSYCIFTVCSVSPFLLPTHNSCTFVSLFTSTKESISPRSNFSAGCSSISLYAFLLAIFLTFLCLWAPQ